MATNYPTSLDDAAGVGSATGPVPATTDTTDSPSHAALHQTTGDGLVAVEGKVGTGASTPTASTVLAGTGSGTSAWGTVTAAHMGLAWTAYTPVLSGTGWTAGNATFDCAHIKQGALVHVVFNITFGSTSTFGSGALAVSVPYATVADQYLGMAANAWDVSSGVVAPLVTRTVGSTIVCYALASATQQNNGGLVAAVPFTWASGDKLQGLVTYRTT